MSDQLTPEEIAQLEAELERITVEDVLMQTVVSLLNIGARKAGLAAAPEEQAAMADWPQVQQAIEGARALLPLLEAKHAADLGPVRDALARLQMLYAQRAPGTPPPAGAPEPEAPQPGEPGPAQKSGRLWVPGQ